MLKGLRDPQHVHQKPQGLGLLWLGGLVSGMCAQGPQVPIQTSTNLSTSNQQVHLRALRANEVRRHFQENCPDQLSIGHPWSAILAALTAVNINTSDPFEANKRTAFNHSKAKLASVPLQKHRRHGEGQQILECRSRRLRSLATAWRPPPGPALICSRV